MKKIITILACFALYCTTANAQLKTITNEMIKTKTKAIITLMEQKISLNANPSGLKERYFSVIEADRNWMRLEISLLYIDGRIDVRMNRGKSLFDIGANGLGESQPKSVTDSLMSIQKKLYYDHGADFVYIGLVPKETPFSDRSFYYHALVYFEEQLKKLKS